MMLRVTAGLSFLHHNKVLHGDLKTNNIGVSQDANGRLKAKIIDAGRFRDFSEQTFLEWHSASGIP